MKYVTWNVNSLNARLPFVLEWVRVNAPDVLCLQETKLKDDGFPVGPFGELGYFCEHLGQGRWNGVAILSKAPIENVSKGAVLEEFEHLHEARHISGTTLGVRVHSVYVPNGRSRQDPHFIYKLKWLRDLKELLAVELHELSDVVVAGDFNIAPQDEDVWDPIALEGSTHVSAEERGLLSEITDLGLVDVHRLLNPDKVEFSWWDYRNGAFHKGEGMRIDLALFSSGLAKTVKRVYVDRDARKVSSVGKPSDHAPLVIESSGTGV